MLYTYPTHTCIYIYIGGVFFFRIVLSHVYMYVCMVWYGMVWYGMVWYGMVWYGMYVCMYLCMYVCYVM